MLHVFVETNWVIEYVTPFPKPGAKELLEHARLGRIRLYLPAICLNEAQSKIQAVISRPREHADALRVFLKAWKAETADAATIRLFLDQYEQKCKVEIAAARQNLSSLAEYVEVFALDDEMLSRSRDLSFGSFAGQGNLKPFDQAILAGVLIRASRLPQEDHLLFCSLDSDLQPLLSHGEEKVWLKRLYDGAGLRVQRNFDISGLFARSSEAG